MGSIDEPYHTPGVTLVRTGLLIELNMVSPLRLGAKLKHFKGIWKVFTTWQRPAAETMLKQEIEKLLETEPPIHEYLSSIKAHCR